MKYLCKTYAVFGLFVQVCDILRNMNEIQRDSNGRFLPGTKPPNTIKTTADARSMAAKRWNKAAQASRDRITREAASIDPEVRNVYDAHALMMAKQYTTILDSDRPRMDDAEKLAQLLGTAPRTVDLRVEIAQTQAASPIEGAVIGLIQAITQRVQAGQQDEPLVIEPE